MESKYAGLEATAELVSQLKGITGDKDALNTIDKSNLVAAVNELYNSIFDVKPVLDDWNTTTYTGPDINTNPVFANNTIINIAAGSETSTCTIKYSKDNGTTWQDSNYVNGGYIANITYVGNNTLVAMPGYNNYEPPIYSTDNGATWHNSTLDSGSAYCNNFVHKFDNGNIISFSSSELNGIIISTDNGISWQRTSAPVARAYKKDYSIENNMMCIQMTESGGAACNTIYTIDGGSTWVDMNIIAVHPCIVNQVIYAIKLTEGVMYTSDYGATWNTSSGAPANANIVLYNSVHDTFVVFTKTYKVYYSTDGCATFQQSTMPSGYDITVNIGEHIILSNGTIIFGRKTGSNPVYKTCLYSTDGGVTWLNASSANAHAFVELLDGSVLVLSNDSSYDSCYFSIDNVSAYWKSIGSSQRTLYAVTDKGIILAGARQTSIINKIDVKPKWETAIETLAAQLNS